MGDANVTNGVVSTTMIRDSTQEELSTTMVDGSTPDEFRTTMVNDETTGSLPSDESSTIPMQPATTLIPSSTPMAGSSLESSSSTSIAAEVTTSLQLPLSAADR